MDLTFGIAGCSNFLRDGLQRLSTCCEESQASSRSVVGACTSCSPMKRASAE
jgi:hypothetical protein